MRRSLFLFLAVLTCGCFSRSSVMTSDTFNEIQTGESISQVTAKVGQPYAVHDKSGGTQEYEYIEKISHGNRLVYENHYFIVVKNGVVVGKKTKQESAPAFDLIYQDDPNHHYYP